MVKLGSWGQTIGSHVGIQGQYGLGGLILVLVTFLWPVEVPGATVPPPALLS